jgi:hypothetical protein
VANVSTLAEASVAAFGAVAGSEAPRQTAAAAICAAIVDTIIVVAPI